MSETAPSSQRLGFVGLAALGAPMARNALEAGWRVTIFDDNDKTCEKLVADGAIRAETPRALATHADVVHIAVSTVARLRDVALTDEHGLLAGARPGQTWIIHSTVGPEICIELADRVKPVGVTVIDAPVTGPDAAPQSAAARNVTYIIGADAPALENVREALELSGSKLIHVGDVGAGQIAKLAANALGIVQMQATHETMRVLIELGLSAEEARALLQASSATNWAVEHWSMVSLAGKAPASQRELPAKDLATASVAAEKLGVRLDLAERVKETLNQPGLGFLAGTKSETE